MSASSWQLPLQWPGAAADTVAAPREHLLKAAIVLAMLALTVFDRFGVRLTGDFSIPPAMIAMYAIAAVAVFTGAAAPSLGGALAYLLVACVAALSFLVNASFEPRQFVTVGSLLLVLALYAPFVVSLRAGAFDPQLRRWTLRLYIAFSLFLALAGIAQFFAQFIFRPEWLFDYGPLIPDYLRTSGGWAAVSSANEWIKSNGFFLREPSMFSIAMALAIVCELSTAKRIWVMAILGLALVLTYSGSGLVCLALALLFPFGWRSLLRVLAGLAVAAAVYFLFGDTLNLAYTLGRVDEFNSSQSSAYCRFVYPAAAVLQNIDSHWWASLLGHGPGATARMGATCADLHQPTYAKLLFEYGLAGALAFGALIFGALSRSAVPIRIRVALAVTWLLLGGYLLASEMLLAIYVLSALWDEPAR